MTSKFWNRKKKLPMGTKEQGGPDVFKIKVGYNEPDELFYISLTSRKSFHTARLNLTLEEFQVVLDRMVKHWEDVTLPRVDAPIVPGFESGHVDPDDEMKDLAGK